MTFLEPLFIKNPLLPQYRSPPRYSVKANLTSSGESLDLVDPCATRALLALMDMQAVLGGAASHFGGPSAFAEILSSLYALLFHLSSKEKMDWRRSFQVINDAGHCENGLYALKANYEMAGLDIKALKSFRSFGSPLTGHGEVHLFPEGVYLSNGPLGSALPQAQGLSFADALSREFFKRLTIVLISDGACMEGEAREALAAIPGLARKGKMAPFLLILSDNNTKLSGRIDEQSFSMKSNFSALEEMGWKAFNLRESHHLQSCLGTLEEALKVARASHETPVLVHAKTIKGYGTKQTEASSSGGHGFPLKDPSDLQKFLSEIYKGAPVPKEFLDWCRELEMIFRLKKKEKKPNGRSVSFEVEEKERAREKVQVGVTKALVKKKKEGLPLISVSSDLPGSTGIRGFQDEFSESSIDVGVAEANMISMGAGLSKQGFIPIVDTFAQFGVTKGALPLIMSALSQAPVVAFFSHAGFQDAADGASHQALSYFAMTCSLPFTSVYQLSCSEEAESLVSQALDEFYEKRKKGKIPWSQIFFLGRETFPPSYASKEMPYKLGKAQVLFDNSDQFESSLVLVASGPLLEEGLKAAKELEARGKGSVVIHPSCINHPDLDTFRSYLPRCGYRLLTVEDHQVKGGMGSLLIHALTLSGISLKACSLGVQSVFGQSAYQAKELYQAHKLTAEHLVLEAEKLFSSL